MSILNSKYGEVDISDNISFVDFLFKGIQEYKDEVAIVSILCFSC